MEEGFVPDVGGGGKRMVSKWISGKPEKSFWKGLKVKDRSVLTCVAYRCQGCGLVELYAH
jgi:hypothetical protein